MNVNLDSQIVINPRKSAKSKPKFEEQRSQIFFLPWTTSISKNKSKTILNHGHKKVIGLSKEYRQTRDLFITIMKPKLKVRRWEKDKVWVEIFARKPNHKADVINLVDGICDALKVVINVDDRYFSLWRVDWEISQKPEIVVRVFQ